MPVYFFIFFKGCLLFNRFHCIFCLQTITLWLNNLKTRTTSNAKISVFVICVEVTIYLLLYNLHDYTSKKHLSFTYYFTYVLSIFWKTMSTRQRENQDLSSAEFSMNELLTEHNAEFAIIVNTYWIGKWTNTQLITGTYLKHQSKVDLQINYKTVNAVATNSKETG